MEISGSEESVKKWNRDLWDVRQNEVVNPKLKLVFIFKTQRITSQTGHLQYS